jgi:putative membrane protein
MSSQFSKYQIATAIAVLFHAVGLIGILFFNRQFFVQATALNLLLMFVLLLWTQQEKNGFFLLFVVAAILFGLGAEIVGVNTGALFGDYTYGNVLGYKFMKVPLIIGINWFVIIYCCGIGIHTLLMKAINRISAETKTKPITLKAISVIVDGATIAVFFDWIMEPVAAKLGFWKWADDGEPPFYNYVCWLMVSNIILAVFHFSKFNKQNKFAVNLLLIQMMFFLLLRTFLN